MSPDNVASDTADAGDTATLYELQQAYRIFNGFLLEKHKGIMSPFLHPIGLEKHTDRVRGHIKKSMCFRRMEEKFVSREYETITEFVADFRLMLENCYRHHGIDHWISKQAQKLEIMLEQKLTLLSRTLREKTTLAVTSKGRLGTEDERGPVGTSARRRTVPRSLATITVGGNESIMVQALRLEEQQRVKEEKRQRELDKKEAEETSAKEVEEWERSLLSQANQTPLKTMWELPAIGHFLCLAQAALNLPEIVFFELERCLLMPRCSIFLSKIMSSLLCPPQRRGTLHRRPALTYCRWESELRQRVQGWYYAMGTAEDQGWMAEQLGLSHQFFRTVGVVSPLEENPFHLVPFIQRVWLLKGLCDNVYETQKDVQDAVLGQPIHECRESILGYDGNENAYIHFPHFCGADLRIYCQSVSMPSDFPLPAVWVKRVEPDEGLSEDSDNQKDSDHLVSMEEGSEEKPSSDRRSGGRVKGDMCRGGTGDDLSLALQLVCTSLEELRELISRTEDELDELESTKKTSGRWCFRKEAVKDLHITLIRLLNELSPWEPKLVKAFHRNRLRLKRDFDDFKKHPDYDNFVREDVDRSSFTVVTRQEMLTLNEHRPSTRGLKRLQSDLDENSSLIKRGRINSDELTTSPEAEVENRSREANPAAQQVGETSPVVITTPMAGVQRTHKPIQLYTLLAKNVGNKVTLIHHQPGVISHLPQPTTPTPKHTQMSHTTPIPKTPVQVVYKMPEGMGLVRKAGSPMKIAVQPILDQKTGDKLMQQVVILPSNLLIQKSEGQSHPQQPRTIQVPASKAPTTLSQTSGFTMPQSHDNRIPIQQVAPLKGATPSPTNSPRLQTTSLTTGYKVVQLPGPRVSSTTQNVIPNRSPSNPTSTAFTDPSKPPFPKQELKTVCIRDSQSILVTTRGGNTGVVKVQMSDQSTSGLLPASPVIISPQFKAFLVSKTSPPAAPTVPVVTSATVAQVQSRLSPLRSSTVTSSTTARQSSITAGIQATGQTVGSAVTVAVNQGSNVSSTIAVNSQLPKSIVTVPGNPAGATQTSLVQCVTKPVLKRVCPDERSPFTKFILVSPSSNVTSMAATKVTSTTAPSVLPGQRLMFISQSPAQASHATSSIPRHVSVSGAQSLTTSIPNEAMKIRLNFGQAISSANFGALNKVQRINLLPGPPIRLPQQESALAQSTLKSTSVSGTQAALLTTTSSHLITSTAHLPSSTRLTGSQLQGIPSSSVIPNLSKVTGHPRSSIIRGLITSNPQLPVPVTTPLGLVKTSPLTLPAQVSQSHHSHCVSGVTTPPQISTPQSPIATRSTQQSTAVRPAGNTNPVTSTTTTTVQQKIVINTPAPLAGGTQILLNNTRFVVPPQGLGPGQHVLIISSPAVPVAAPSHRGASPTTSVPQGPTLPGLPTPAQGPRMATQPRTHQPQQAALRSLTLAAPSAEKVGPSLPVSFTVPRQTMEIRAPLSVTSTTINGSPPVLHRLPAPATILTGLANVVAAPPLTQPEGMGGLSLSSVPASSSAAQTAEVLQSPTKQLHLNTGLGINYAPLTTQQITSFVQPIGAVSTRMQVLPTVAVPPIWSTFSRMQSLPVVTVPPLGGAFGSKTSPVATVPPSNSTVIMTPAQPVRTVMSAETIRMPIVLSNPWQQQILGLGKCPLQASQMPASAVQTTSPTTKLLVSPDGAVLNTVRGPTANTGLPEMANKPLATLILTPKSTGRVLPLPPVNTDNPWMPTQADRSGPIN
uniref:Bromodomain containing 10 n=1 Tax=Salmo trutta TaxID=8032 RepID=A0A673YB91_SALTR